MDVESRALLRAGAENNAQVQEVRSYDDMDVGGRALSGTGAENNEESI